ncbi:MAG: hypothetical protein R3B84_16770 [Zavarzinella sp.]
MKSDINNFKQHVDRFITALPKYRDWHKEYAGIAPVLNPEERAILNRHDMIPQDLNDLTQGLS